MIKKIFLFGVVMGSLLSHGQASGVDPKWPGPQDTPVTGKSASARLNNYFREVVKSLPKEPRQIPSGAKEILEQLDKEFPSDIEIILSYGTKSKRPWTGFGVNPMGHIAIKIDNTVHTINGLAIRGEDAKIIQDGSMFQYLYGLQAPTKNIFHGDAYGNSYIQGAVVMKVSGVTREEKDLMLQYVNYLNRKFNEGYLEFQYTSFNCSTYVYSALTIGGLIPNSLTPELLKIKEQGTKMPLDIFTLALGVFESDPKYRVKLVAFPQITLPDQIVTGVDFPVSTYRPKEMYKTWFQDSYSIMSKVKTAVVYDKVSRSVSRVER
ncbi:MAG: hypothetical protein JNM24_11720 [Bdellovibrionaceae bacterium]|nr:hypothetical protein [Pseudobdellovibrionaceae bacterium]